jgi:cytochrome P450
MKISDPKTFAYAAMAVSGHLFGKPPIINNSRATNEGAAYVRAAIDRSIQGESRARSSVSPESDTVLSRLVSPKAGRSTSSSPDENRALIMGMIVGFVPTSTMASGHILETLLKRKSSMRCASDAARTGDDDLLKRCLYEASRFWPINPGPFRICEQDYELGGDAKHARTIKKGSTLLVSTMSAMFDSRQVDQPFKFNGDRPASNYMLFGHGLHWCVGAFIAQAHLTQTFKVLLRHGEFKRAAGDAGKLRLYNGFPEHLTVQFGTKR